MAHDTAIKHLPEFLDIENIAKKHGLDSNYYSSISSVINNTIGFNLYKKGTAESNAFNDATKFHLLKLEDKVTNKEAFEIDCNKIVKSILSKAKK